jgi:hypothetical protein
VPRDCAILFTHLWSPALAKHVERLKRETAGVIDVFVALHAEPGKPIPPGMSPDITVATGDLSDRIPARLAGFKRKAWTDALMSHTDVIWLAALLHERVANYDRLWFIEYDVDLKGNWGRFFRAAATYEGDLLLTRLHRLSQDPGWYHAPGLQLPGAVADPLIGLFCISRFSRKLAETYADAMAVPGWDGNFEAVIPSFAESAGFSIAEISGEGAWTPPERTNLHYRGTFMASASAHTTFSFRPPHAYTYFKSSGRRGDTLYHPVKTGLPLRKRLRLMENDFRLGRRPPPT